MIYIVTKPFADKKINDEYELKHKERAEQLIEAGYLKEKTKSTQTKSTQETK